MGPRRSHRLSITLAFLALLAALYFGRALWLTAAGKLLVHDDGPGKAEVAVMLAGDSWGFRMKSSAELVRQGYVGKVLVSGPVGMYGINEADAAIDWAVRQGYPPAYFLPVRHLATSTRDESAVMLWYMREHGIHSFVLVTSNFHTARARRIYLKAERAAGGGPEFRVMASDDKYYAAGSWWHTREGWKIAFMEWAKTVSGAFGI